MKPLTALVLAGLTVFLGAGAAAAAQDFGPATPPGDEGDPTLGVGYQYYSSEWKTDNEDLSVDRFDRNIFWLNASLVFHRSWEAYVRYGFANAKIKGAFPFSPPRDFDGDYGWCLSGGVRGSFYRGEMWGIGAFFQATTYSDHEQTREGTLDPDIGSGEAAVAVRYQDQYDANIGLNFELFVEEKYIVYLGPFLYWAKTNARAEVVPESGDPVRLNGEGEQKNQVGGFIGLALPLGSTMRLNIEGQYKTRASGSISVTKSLGSVYGQSM
jgi:hypothetical protein